MILRKGHFFWFGTASCSHPGAVVRWCNVAKLRVRHPQARVVGPNETLQAHTYGEAEGGRSEWDRSHGEL